MKTYLTYGFAMALGGALISFAMFFLGLHDSPSKLDLAQWIQMGCGIALGVTCIVLGTKARRAEVPAGAAFGYGSALVTTYVYLAIINPGYGDVVLQAQAEKLEGKGLKSEQIEQIQKMSAIMMKPGVMTAFSFIAGLFFGTVISLISAAFLKRPAVEDAGDAPPTLN